MNRLKTLLQPLVLSLIILSCGNIINPPAKAKVVHSNEEGMARVSFTISSLQDRTILPEINLSELTYRLTGKTGEHTKQLAEFSGDGTSLSLESGAWSFTLHALLGSTIVLTAESEALLMKDQSATVSFALKPLKEGAGAINISFSFPAAAGITSVQTSGDISAKTYILQSGSPTWVYGAADMMSDDYFAGFTFYRGNAVAAAVSEIIQVRQGLTSKKTINVTVKDGAAPPEPPPVIHLESGWTQGSVDAGGEQLFSFTARADTEYIHLKLSTATHLNVLAEGSASGIYGSSSYATRSGFTIGETYPITVTPEGDGAGDYEIMVSESPMLEGTPLALDPGSWLAGEIIENGDEWFEFTPTAAHQYVHARFGALTSFTISVYDSHWNPVVEDVPLSSETAYANLTGLSDSQTYTIRVYAAGDTSGDYEIAFNDSQTPPADPPPDPPPTVTLNEGVWSPGNIELGGEDWFEFTATVSYHYIHVKFGTLDDIYGQIFESDNQLSSQSFYFSDNTTYIDTYRLTVGQKYRIKIMPYDASKTGGYRIALNDNETPPPITLAEGVWSQGYIETGEEEFEFTASVTDHYIHFKFGELDDIYIRVFNGDEEIDTYVPLNPGSPYASFSGFTVGNTCTVIVTPRAPASGDYEITFNQNATPPP